MAIYNPLPQSNDPNYLRYSREPGYIQPNTGIGGLLKNVGEIFGEAVSGVDTLIKQDIEKQAYDKLDANRQAETQKLAGEISDMSSGTAGAPNTAITPTPESTGKQEYSGGPESYIPGVQAQPQEASIFGNTGTPAPDTFIQPSTDISSQNIGTAIAEPVPPEVVQNVQSRQEAANQLKRLRAAGKISDADYELRASVIASDLKSQYPGYRAYIDTTVKSILGVDPANAALARLRAARESLITAQKTATDDWSKWVETNRGVLGEKGVVDPTTGQQIVPGYLQALSVTDPARQAAIKARVAGIVQEDHNLQRLQHEAEAYSKINGLNKERAESTIAGIANSVMNKTLDYANQAATNMGAQTIQQVFDSITSEVIQDPVRNQRLGNMVDITLDNYYRNFDSIVYQQRKELAGPDGQPRSLAQITTPERLKQMREEGAYRLIQMKEAVLGKDNNRFAVNGKILNASRDSAAIRVLDADPNFRLWSGIVRAMPEIGQGYVTLLQAEKLSNWNESMKAARSIVIPGIVTGNQSLMDGNKTFHRVVSNNEAGAQKKESAWNNEMIRTTHQAILDPKSPPEVVAGAAVSLSKASNGEFVRTFDANDRYDAWAIVSKKEVAQKIKDTDPTSFRYFMQWNDTTFKQLFRDYADTVQTSGIQGDRRLNIRYNPETMQIDYDKPSAVHPGVSGRYGSATVTPATRAIDKFNIGLQVRRNLLEVAGVDPKTQIPNDLASFGIDFDKHPPTQGSLNFDLYGVFKNIGTTINNKFKEMNAPSEPKIFQQKRSEGSQSPQIGSGEASVQLASYLAPNGENASAGNLERLQGLPREITAGPGGNVPLNPEATGSLPRNALAYQGGGKLQVNGNVDLRHVEANTRGVIQDAVKEGLPIHLISGYRSPGYNASVGGARGSQHMHGKAFDVDLKHMSEDEKQAVVSHFLSDPRVGGFGYYPGSDTIHVDTRDNKAAWGSNRSSSSIGKGWPGWLTRQVRGWLQSSTEGTQNQTKLAEVLPPNEEIPNDWQELFQHENGRATSGRFKGMTAEEIQQKLGPAYDVFTQPKGFMGIRNRPAPKGPLVAMNTEGFGQSDNIEDVRRPIETPQTLLEREQLMEPTPEKVRGQRQLEEGPPPKEFKRRRRGITVPSEEEPVRPGKVPQGSRIS